MKAPEILKARDLRRHMTDAERRLWARLKQRQMLGCKFRRQHPIGPFIADFACVEHKLVIEVDGSQHGENTAHDRERRWFLQNEGFRILRFWNEDVMRDLDAVLDAIGGALAGASPPR